MTVAILGAGIAGLSAATRLLEMGHQVVVFDKSRGVGGRTATRRCGDYRFDHGAQYFTAREGSFRSKVEHWLKLGIVEAWQGEVGVWESTGISKSSEPPTRYVGVPGMTAMAKELAEGLDVRLQEKVVRATPTDGGWHLGSERELGHFEWVVSSLPPAQASALFAEHSVLKDRLEKAVMSPCWAGMVVLPSRLETPWDALFVNEGPLRWVARNNSKPGRPEFESWVLHGSELWSQEMIGSQPDEVVSLLWEAFAGLCENQCPKPLSLVAHRWLYSVTKNSPSELCLVDEKRALALCGDWCIGARVEGAWLSGQAAAERVLEKMSRGVRA